MCSKWQFSLRLVLLRFLFTQADLKQTLSYNHRLSFAVSLYTYHSHPLSMFAVSAGMSLFAIWEANTHSGMLARSGDLCGRAFEKKKYAWHSPAYCTVANVLAALVCCNQNHPLFFSCLLLPKSYYTIVWAYFFENIFNVQALMWLCKR